ncbi:MAG: sodium/proline symporter PutP [Candidatus Dasytiphilus stammeri]
MVISIPMLVTFFIYIFVILFIGFIAFRSTKNFDDYILGGRRLGSLVTALSAGASDMSGWLLMGLPGAIFLFGLSESWIAIGLAIGAYLNWKLVAARLRIHTEVHGNSLTLPDYFTSRFEDHSKMLRLISALIILIFFTIYCASGIVAGARLFESTFGFSYNLSLWLGAAATIFYTFMGGFLAVSWTDTIQASLMIFALIFTPIIVIIDNGGISNSMQAIAIKNIEYINMLSGLNWIAIISLLSWGLGYFGQPHILARFMAADSHHTIRNARIISMTWMILCLLGALAIGFFSIAYFQIHPEQSSRVLENSERVFIELTRLLFSSWIAGILFSAILATIMSTLSCQLLVSASALTEDIYRAFFRKKATQLEMVWIGRMMVLVVALVSIKIAVNPENRVLGLVSYAWAGFGAAFGPVILLSVIWSRMTRNGALAGMLIGTLTVLIWKQYAWLGLYEIIPGFIFATISILIVSIFDGPPSNQIIRRFIEAKAEYDSE